MGPLLSGWCRPFQVAALTSLNDYLTQNGPYIGGANVCATDLGLAPKLYHLKTALKHFKVRLKSAEMTAWLLLCALRSRGLVIAFPHPKVGPARLESSQALRAFRVFVGGVNPCLACCQPSVLVAAILG